MANVNICVGIDAGTYKSKLAYSDNLSTRIIARLEGFNADILREEAEIFFDEPVFSCVVALPESLSQRERDTISVKTKFAGFRDVNIINKYEAVNLALGNSGSVLFWDFGASMNDIAVLENGEVLENAIISDVTGDSIDKIFAEYLSERRMQNVIDENLLREADRIKIALSESEYITWHEVNIFREELERLIYFPVKRAIHTGQRLARIHRPDKFIVTGGMMNIPVVRKIISENLKLSPEIHDDIIAKGASMKARSLMKAGTHDNNFNATTRLRELRADIIEIEDKLNRNQKDRLYMLFRQAEGINDAGIIALMENLIHEIRDA